MDQSADRIGLLTVLCYVHTLLAQAAAHDVDGGLAAADGGGALYWPWGGQPYGMSIGWYGMDGMVGMGWGDGIRKRGRRHPSCRSVSSIDAADDISPRTYPLFTHTQRRIHIHTKP